MNNLRRTLLKPNLIRSLKNFTNIRYFALKTINVPFMGDSITEGKIIELNKKPGDLVEVDELVAVVETDKTSLEIRSSDSGTLKRYFHPVDATIEVNTPLFEIDTPTKAPAPPTEKKKNSTQIETKVSENKTKTNTQKSDEIINPKQKPLMESKPVIKAENLEKSLRGEKKIPLSRMRIKIAQRLKESQNTAASLTTFNQIDCYNILKMRQDFKEKFLESTGAKLGLMSPFVKASTLALLKFPEVNAYFDLEGKCITLHDYVDVSVAVAGPKGLVVPVLRNTERMSFADIEKGIRGFALQAKEGNLSLEDMKGGTFTVSNSGVFKSLIGTPIINPPQAAVLGMYGIFDTPVAINNKVEIRPVMKVALTYDHRVVDGREAVLFLRQIKEYIENPIAMMLAMR